MVIDRLCRWFARRRAIAMVEHDLMRRVALLAPHALYDNPWRARRAARRMAVMLVDSGAAAADGIHAEVGP